MPQDQIFFCLLARQTLQGPRAQVFAPPLMSHFTWLSTHYLPNPARATTSLVWCCCGLPVLRLKYNAVMTSPQGGKKNVYSGKTSTTLPMTTSDDKVLVWLQSSFSGKILWFGRNLFWRPPPLHSSYLCKLLVKSQSVSCNIRPPWKVYYTSRGNCSFTQVQKIFAVGVIRSV